ncbi:MAG TPA: hypothetical protein DHV62_04535 [Elusimicrobia bacterium]|jgi:LmbE family N-acetylglucosaminyl deacetylase|nr:hypothetical protein [Elusimicrobiota bacterium]
MNILAIGPHPDDIEFGCGGTLLGYAGKRNKIYLLVMTKGEHGGNAKLRESEQKKSTALIKAELFWGGYKDTQIPLGKDSINTIEKIIKIVKPDIIFTPYFNDTHQDHRNVSQATITATRYIHNVLFYEVPTTVDFSPTSIFVDIGKVLEEKMNLLKAHRSQVFATKVAGLSILDSAHSTAIFRGYQNRVKYAEGFVPLRLSLNI